MLFCKNCGTQLKEGAAFCKNCGIKIGDKPTISDEIMPACPQEQTENETVEQAAKLMPVPVENPKSVSVAKEANEKLQEWLPVAKETVTEKAKEANEKLQEWLPIAKEAVTEKAKGANEKLQEWLPVAKEAVTEKYKNVVERISEEKKKLQEKTEAAEEVIYCSECGTPSSARFKFCRKCGTPLE